ncbi:hypothetical protein SODALDRAFT_276486 [Sodiomyces alkalinus F11]|uniref:Cupin type-2 domain-containing protein n=1 Tax=Sodiomyces alkalinus (strain CBS 110278 / VKM F-3762 / F11) TaxID=1314773 RepID=A0A3N2PWM9_SODAK|nr:hypothetical protein SODALDRAFT_276486 [Sodiomyces alkalinus F11]ROT38908.1 hypothetical protein SODALDRAFT_276486 [Sodiomyces alkalinus F11]
MARSWQLWLSRRPLRRTKTPSGPQMLSPNDAALYEFLYEKNGRLTVKETHYADNQTVRDGLSGPPLHIHLRQTEYFRVLQGELGVVRNEKKGVLRKEDGILVIPPGTRHRFWPHTPIKQDLIFHVWAEPPDVDHGFDENYLRNALGYVRDCAQQNIAPSIFQMALFGWSSDTIFICPPFWVPIWILVFAQYVAGHIIGGFLLG